MNYPQHNIGAETALYNNVEPVVFTKADSALLKDRKPFFVPDWCERVDFEAELVVASASAFQRGLPIDTMMP